MPISTSETKLKIVSANLFMEFIQNKHESHSNFMCVLYEVSKNKNYNVANLLKQM